MNIKNENSPEDMPEDIYYQHYYISDDEKRALEEVDFLVRYKELSRKFNCSLDLLFEDYQDQEVINILKQLGEVFTYYKAGDEFVGAQREIGPYKFTHILDISRGITKFSCIVKSEEEPKRNLFDNDWGLLEKLGITENKPSSPKFRNYDELREILKEYIALERDIRTAFLRIKGYSEAEQAEKIETKFANDASEIEGDGDGNDSFPFNIDKLPPEIAKQIASDGSEVDFNVLESELRQSHQDAPNNPAITVALAWFLFNSRLIHIDDVASLSKEAKALLDGLDNHPLSEDEQEERSSYINYSELVDLVSEINAVIEQCDC